MMDASVPIDLARKLEANEAAAYRSLFATAGRIHNESAFETRSVGGALMLLSPAMRRAGVFNRVLELGLGQPAESEHLDEIIQTYRELGCGLALELTPPVLTPELMGALRERRIRRGSVSAVVYREASKLAQHESVRVRRAAAADATRVASICAEVFSMPRVIEDVLHALVATPGWRGWIAEIDGQSVGAGFSFVQGSLCWFGWAATLEAFRGRGVKSAIDRCFVNDAAESGCEWVSAETASGSPDRPDHSLKSFHRLGFVTAYLRGSYLLLETPTGRNPALPPR